MAKVLVIGATGGIGFQLCQQLIEQGHSVVGLHRLPEQADVLLEKGITPALGDLTTIPMVDLSAMMAEVDVVIFSAGAGGGSTARTDAIDGEGLVKAVRAAMLVGARRFLLVSAFPDAGRGKNMSDDFEHYMAVKRKADVYLAATNLDWVILRPGTLSDAPGTGRVRAGLAIPYGDVPRADVARVLCSLVDMPKVNRVIIELTAGDTPVADAISKLVR